jgi:SAM-dependent methyltransferase
VRRARRHGWLQMPPPSESTVLPKPASYLPVYEELLGGLRRRPIKLLELGILGGDSLQMWRDAFPRATIVGVDLTPPDRDLGRRVVMVAGDQADADLLRRVSREQAPGGWDVVIDDASHVGQATARSLMALYRDHLRPGGVYVIEDWGTGYHPDFPDGGRLAEPLSAERIDREAPSHQHGMVGLVKRLIDHINGRRIEEAFPELVDSYFEVESVRITEGMVAITKPA